MKVPQITLKNTVENELRKIIEMEQSDARHFIIPYPLKRHRQELHKPSVKYKSIYVDGEMTGFLILVLDPGGKERRIQAYRYFQTGERSRDKGRTGCR